MQIFPYLSVSFLQDKILFLTDVDSQLRLSQVSKSAQSVLNNEHFRKLFEQLHPRLASSPYIFRVLRTFHPDSCWKAASWILERPNRQITNLHFLSRAIVQLPHLKGTVEYRIGELLGSGEGDPSSLIGIAQAERNSFAEFGVRVGQAKEMNRKLGQKLKSQSLQARRDLKTQIAHLEFPDQKQILESIQLIELWVKEELWAMPEEGLLDILKERLTQLDSYAILERHNIGFFNDNYLHLRLRKAKIEREMAYFNEDPCYQENWEKFRDAESRCQFLQEELGQQIQLADAIGSDMMALKSLWPEVGGWILEQHDFLALETGFARDVEALRSEEELPILDLCIINIHALFLLEVDSDAYRARVEELKQRLDSLSPLTTGRVYQKLYDLCAREPQGLRGVRLPIERHLGVLRRVLMAERTLRRELQQLLLQGKSASSHSSMGNIDASNYRQGLLVFGPEFDRASHLPVGEAEVVKRAASKWKLLEELLSEPPNLSEKQWHQYNMQFGTSPLFGNQFIISIYMGQTLKE